MHTLHSRPYPNTAILGNGKSQTTDLTSQTRWNYLALQSLYTPQHSTVSTPLQWNKTKTGFEVHLCLLYCLLAPLKSSGVTNFKLSTRKVVIRRVFRIRQRN